MATTLPNLMKEGDENLETYSLVWLDVSVNNSRENHLAQKRLRTSINYLITFEDDQQCLQYIESVPKDDRIILIVSGQIGPIIVPKIVQLKQIFSIYIYCVNKRANEQWAKQFNKIKDVITELDKLIDRIQADQHQRKHNKIDESLPMYVIHSNDVYPEKSTSELCRDFLHSQLLIDCLIKMEWTENDKNELISLCKQQYAGNIDELKIIKEFELEYLSDRALWWYTRDSFLYKMLNKALRVKNIHLLFLFRFIIGDIEKQLEKNKCSSPVRVYRAQLLSNDEVEMLTNALGEYIAMDSFFSTSLNREQARSFFSSDISSNDVQRVFFEIDADPRLDNIKPFSDISSFSSYPDEKEVLFMIGSVFRLVNINRDQDGILIVRMKLFSLNDDHLNSLFQHIQKKQKNGKTNLPDFGSMLKDMGELDNAEKYYRRYLNELSGNDKDIARCYYGLGMVAEKKCDYESSLKWYNKSLQLKILTLKPYDPNIAGSYLSIGNVYEEKGDHVDSLESYEKALLIYKQAFGEDHLDIAGCMNNMGNSYMRKHEYPKALELYQKVLSIREKHLPVNHYSLGASHGNIGSIYKHLGDYDLALAHYNLELKIYIKSRPSQHPSIGLVMCNIGLVYENKNEFEQALSYFEKAATIYHHSFPPTHPDVTQIKKNLRRVSSKL